jgi:trehalose-phosphatase
VDLDGVLQNAMKAARVLVISDFDGTLAPFVAHRDDARMPVRAAHALEQLAAQEGVEVVILSGRSLDDLRARTRSVPSSRLIASHGVEDPDSTEGSDTADLAARRNELAAAVRDLVGGLDGVDIEIKPAAIAVHYRTAEPGVAAITRDRLDGGPVRWPEISTLHGASIVEMLLSATTKGDAVRRLLTDESYDVIIFAGDDTTDETVFQVLRAQDVGIHVCNGESTFDSAAQFELPSTNEWIDTLERMNGWRRAWTDSV